MRRNGTVPRGRVTSSRPLKMMCSSSASTTDTIARRQIFFSPSSRPYRNRIRKVVTTKAYSLVGTPDDLEWEDQVVAVLEARDGTILDVVRKIKPLKL